MRKIISTIITAVLSINITAHCAEINFTKNGNVIKIDGLCKENSVYTVNVKDNLFENLYAMEEFCSDDNGSINKEIILPDNMPAGEYSLTIGGQLSNTNPMSERKYQFSVERSDIDIEYLSSTVSGVFKKGTTFNCSVNVNSKTTPLEDVVYTFSLKHRGMVVISKEVVKPYSESLGEYTLSISAQIPYLAPDSDDYTLEIAIKNGVFSDGEAIKKISDITVGTPVEKPIQPLAVFDNVYIEKNKLHVVSSMENVSGIYAKFIKDSAVYAILECDYSENAVMDIPKLPAGEYIVKVSFYGARGESSTLRYSSDKACYKKPYSCGTYINPETGNEHFWYINENATMIRDGKPYVPMGGMICLNTITGYNKSNDWINRQNWINDKKRLQGFYDKGIRDIYVNCINDEAPPWVITELCNYLDNVGFNYGIQYGCDKLDKELYYIRANEGSKAVFGAKDSAAMDFQEVVGTLTGGIYTAVRSGRAVISGECTVNGTTLIADLPEGTYDVYFTPKVKHSVATFNNFWENRDYFEDTREEFATQLSGENFITVIDPVANETGMYNYLESIRPCSEEYDALFKKWLINKYSNEEMLSKAWGADKLDFDTASGLIPVYTNTVSMRVYASCVKTGKIYNLDAKNGIMWQDFLEFRDLSYAEFYNDVADAIKRGADVPVIIKNVWGHKEYFINRRTVGGFDGLGAESYGDIGGISGKTFSNLGMTKQFAKTAWSIVTETSTDEDTYNKYNSGAYGYGTEEYMKAHFDAHFNSGARGIYDFIITCPHDSIIQTAYSYEENPEQFEWLNNYRANLDAEEIAVKSFSKTTVALMNFNSNFYTTPNRWTAVLPKQYSEVFGAYVSQNFAVWQTDEVMDCDILASTFENKPASVIWGPKFTSKLVDEDQKLLYIGFRKDIGEVEELDKYFTAKFDKNENGVLVQILKETKTSTVLARTADGKPYALKDGNLYIIAAADAGVASGLNYIDEIGILYDKLGFYADVPVISNPDSNGVSNITSTAYNTYSDTMHGKIIAATYDKTGKLNKTKLTDFTLNRGTLELDINISPATGDEIIKCFIIGDNMQPLSKAQIKEVKN